MALDQHVGGTVDIEIGEHCPNMPDGPFAEEELVTIREWCRWRDMVRAEITRIWFEEVPRMTRDQRATFAKGAESKSSSSSWAIKITESIAPASPGAVPPC